MISAEQIIAETPYPNKQTGTGDALTHIAETPPLPRYCRRLSLFFGGVIE